MFRHPKTVYVAIIILIFVAIPELLALSPNASPSYFLKGNFLVSVSKTKSANTDFTYLAPKTLISRNVYYLFDWKQLSDGVRLLISLNDPTSSSSNRTGGHDLAIMGSDGKSKELAANVSTASLSPNGQLIAYTTPAGTLNLIDLDGRLLFEINNASDQAWSPTSQELVFVQFPSASERSEAEEIVVLDVATFRLRRITLGEKDHAPIYTPSGRSIIFTSGSRTGIASLWIVPVAGGAARQLTNIGLRQIDNQFVPTPYRTQVWSPNGRSLAYDRLDGSSTSAWVLKFDPDLKNVISAERVGEGLLPRWLDDYSLVGQTENEKFILMELPR